jgi:hypothetical protein
MCWGCFQHSIKFRKLKQMFCILFGHKWVSYGEEEDKDDPEWQGCSRCGDYR